MRGKQNLTVIVFSPSIVATGHVAFIFAAGWVGAARPLTADLAAFLVRAVAAAVLARADDLEGAAVAVLAPEWTPAAAAVAPMRPENAPEERRQRIWVTILQ